MDRYFLVTRSTKETFAMKPIVLIICPHFFFFYKKYLDMFRVRGKLT